MWARTLTLATELYTLATSDRTDGFKQRPRTQ